MTDYPNPRQPGAGAPRGGQRRPYGPPNRPARPVQPRTEQPRMPWQQDQAAGYRREDQPRQDQIRQDQTRQAGGGRQRRFGQVDPFCWIAAGPLFVVGIALAVMAGNAWIGLVGVTLAAGLVIFDARVNRPIPGQARRTPPPQRRTPPPPRRPAPPRPQY